MTFRVSRDWSPELGFRAGPKGRGTGGSGGGCGLSRIEGGSGARAERKR